MSVETKSIITCDRCGKKSTTDNYKGFCSKTNSPSVDHLHSFGTKIGRNPDKIGVYYFNINIKIKEDLDLCPLCRSWIDDFFDEQADKIEELLEQEW